MNTWEERFRLPLLVIEDYITTRRQANSMVLFNAPRGWGILRFACAVVKLMPPATKVQMTAHGARLTSLLAKHLHAIGAPADQVLLTDALEGTLGDDACNTLIITPECFRVFFQHSARQSLIENKHVILFHDGAFPDDFLGNFEILSQVEHKAMWLHERSADTDQPFFKLLQTWVAMRIVMKK